MVEVLWPFADAVASPSASFGLDAMSTARAMAVTASADPLSAPATNPARLIALNPGAVEIATEILVSADDLKINRADAGLDTYVGVQFEVAASMPLGKFRDRLFMGADVHLPKDHLYTLNNSGSSVIIVGDESGAEKAYKAYYKDKAPTGLIGLTISRILTTYVEGNPHEILYKRYPNLVKKYTKEVLDKKIIEFFLIHEVGHLMDIISYYKNSSNGGFEEIYKEEKENFKELEVYKSGGLSLEDNISTIPEYFASAFACFFIDGEELKEKCPKTYQHIEKRLEKMKNKLIMSR